MHILSVRKCSAANEAFWSICRLKASTFQLVSIMCCFLTSYLTCTLSFKGNGGWSPRDSDQHQWLQVDLKARKQITAVATQGRYSSSDWTKHYRLLYSDTGSNWNPYQQDGNIWVSCKLADLFLGD